MKKKIIAATLSAALAASFVLTGCGSTSDADATETIVESTEKVSVAEEESTEAESTETEAAEELVVKRKSISKASIKEEPIEETEETEREDGIASESAGYAYTDEEADGDTSDGSAGIAAGVGSVSNAADTSSTDTVADGFDKAAAQQVWASVNAERAAAGLNTLAWDEETYNFACQRAQAIVTNFSHDGCGNYGENIHWASYIESADSIHQSWYNSSGHHENYMRDIYTKGACAVYYYNGGTYAVENFVASWNDSSYSSTVDNSYEAGEEDAYEAVQTTPSGTPITASNGVTVYVEDFGDGSMSFSVAAGTDPEASENAMNEVMSWYYQ
jgi:uncharacterized protein YkwD